MLVTSVARSADGRLRLDALRRPRHTSRVIRADAERVRLQLDKMLASEQFAKSEASRKLLSYLAERSLRDEAPKETEIALDVFGKDSSFSGAEQSTVRVSVRTLRQKLAEYYAGAGRDDPVRFEIPKGGYRLLVTSPDASSHGATTTNPMADAHDPSAAGTPSASPAEATSPGVTPAVATPAVGTAATRRSRPWSWVAAAALAVLAVSISLNVYLWNRPHAQPGAPDPQLTQVRASLLWSDMVKSDRPVTLILGDLFMFTQIDPMTGRTLTVRDAGINSSEELRAILANHPTYATERGQRYVTMVQKTVAVGMADVMRIIYRPGRRIEVVAQDDVSSDQIRNNDVIYLGPLVRLGALGSHYAMQSRYRFSSEGSTITDVATGKTYLPQGELNAQHVDYALAAKFLGPTGNHMVILSAGARNAGVLQIVRTATSAQGVNKIDERLRTDHAGDAGSFEMLLTVTGFKQTDLAAEIVNVTPMPAPLTQARKTPASSTQR